MKNLPQRVAAADRPQLGGRVPVMAFVADADSERAIGECLAGQAAGDCVTLRGGIAKAIEHLGSERSPNVLIVDLSGIDLPVSLVHVLADVCEPGVTVIAIGDRDDIGLYRDLLHAGVSDYIVKPLTPQLVARAMQVSANADPAVQISQKLGRMVAFVGARGGVGTTTLATNLAWYLANRQNRRVVLLDLDLQNGDCALTLNVSSASGLRDALDSPTRVDATLLERAMAPCGERLFVLGGEEPLTDAVAVTPEAVEAIVAGLRPLFHYVIVDVPRTPSTAHRRVLELADLRIIVADQTLRAARDAARLRAVLGAESRGHRNLLVVNRAGEGGSHAVMLSELTDVVQLPSKNVIAYEPKLFSRSALSGRPPVAARGRFSAGIADLAGELSSRAPQRRRFWEFRK